jgi:hypothetical protein
MSTGIPLESYPSKLHPPAQSIFTFGIWTPFSQTRCAAGIFLALRRRLSGQTDEQKPAKEGSVEAWARSEDNPIGGWYGLKTGLRGRVGNHVSPVLEVLGLAEVEHNARNNRMRAI